MFRGGTTIKTHVHTFSYKYITFYSRYINYNGYKTQRSEEYPFIKPK